MEFVRIFLVIIYGQADHEHYLGMSLSWNQESYDVWVEGRFKEEEQELNKLLGRFLLNML